MTRRRGRTSTRAGAVALAALAGLSSLVACSSDDGATPEASTTTAVVPLDDLALNEIQVIGTHNSFHEAAPPDEQAQLAALDPEAVAERDYTHAPLPTQLGGQRVRQVELDVFLDGEGGRFATPALRDPAEGPVPGMEAPGIKVLHEQDVDYHATCPTLIDCLSQIEAWSDADPGHVPIAVFIQFKDGPLIFDVPDQAGVELWTSEAMATLDEEIRSVFDPADLLVPDDVRGDRPTLAEAIEADGWPRLGDTRGKVMFAMINGAPYRDRYLELHPNLAEGILFTTGDPGADGADDVVVASIDDPVAEGERIAELVRDGYLVRTRSDTPGVEAPAGDTARLEAALASGAHWISTDHPGPDGAAGQYDSDYVAELPGFLAARCNPIVAVGCEDSGVEPTVR